MFEEQIRFHLLYFKRAYLGLKTAKHFKLLHNRFQDYQKREPLFKIKKTSKKSAQCRKKNQIQSL